MARFEFIRCSVIKYRGNLYVLYPLRESMEKVRQLHGKKVYAIVIAEE